MKGEEEEEEGEGYRRDKGEEEEEEGKEFCCCEWSIVLGEASETRGPFTDVVPECFGQVGRMNGEGGWVGGVWLLLTRSHYVVLAVSGYPVFSTN